MSTPYQRGTAFEHRTKALLEEAGRLVTRSPGSKSPFDLLSLAPAGSRALPVLVQCKLRGSISRGELRKLYDLAMAYGCNAVLAYTMRERGEIHFRVIVRYGDGSWGRVSWSP